MSTNISEQNKAVGLLYWISLAFMLVAMNLIFLYAPTEKMEGVIQRVMYFHIPCAWLAFFAFFVVFVASILFLWKKDRKWDVIAHSSAEIGIIFCSLVLITGPIWAKPIWGAWWTWDARLTSTLILWLIYMGYLMLRAHAEAGSQRARYAAVLGIIGFLDVPIIHFSVIKWRTFHPQPKMLNMKEGIASGMDPSMAWTLMVSLVAFTLLYFLLMNQRIKIERMKDEVLYLKHRVFS